jgi:hypothetical protein
MEVQDLGGTAGHPATRPLYLIVGVKEPATNIVRNVLTGAKYEEVVGVLENRHGIHHLVEAFRARLRTGVYQYGKTAEICRHQKPLAPRRLY